MTVPRRARHRAERRAGAAIGRGSASRIRNRDVSDPHFAGRTIVADAGIGRRCAGVARFGGGHVGGRIAASR
ncbi:hypothetical protein BURMUCF1_2960, partial [Burkholderia multivorans ATCC BAA-247]